MTVMTMMTPSFRYISRMMRGSTTRWGGRVKNKVHALGGDFDTWRMKEEYVCFERRFYAARVGTTQRRSPEKGTPGCQQRPPFDQHQGDHSKVRVESNDERCPA